MAVISPAWTLEEGFVLAHTISLLTQCSLDLIIGGHYSNGGLNTGGSSACQTVHVLLN